MATMKLEKAVSNNKTCNIQENMNATQGLPMPLETSSNKCPLCNNSGLVVDFESKIARVCGCMKATLTENLMRTSNISDEFVNKSFETFNIKNQDKRVISAYQTAMRYSNHLVERIKKYQGLKGAPWLGLLGMPGSGKTHLAHAAAKPLFELGIRVFFFNWVSSFSEWMAAYNSDKKNRVDDIRQEIYNCDLLVMDDLCKECINETWIKETYGIIDYRYRKGLPIIYTSEYYSELVGMLSEATAGRLFEMSGRIDPPALALMFLKSDENPLSLDYRLKSVLRHQSQQNSRNR